MKYPVIAALMLLFCVGCQESELTDLPENQIMFLIPKLKSYQGHPTCPMLTDTVRL